MSSRSSTSFRQGLTAAPRSGPPELFERIGPRLKDRLGDVAVLPVAGRQAWLRSAAANEQRFRGQHGGLHEAETSTYLARLTD